MLGTFLSSHPLEKHANVLCNHNIFPIKSVNTHPKDAEIKILGMIVGKKVIYTKRDSQPMAFIQIEDVNSKLEGVIFQNHTNV